MTQAPNPQSVGSSFADRLREVLSEVKTSADWEVTTITSFSDLPNHFASKKIPHIAIFDVARAPTWTSHTLKRFFSGLREIDSGICLLVTHAQKPKGAETMAWLDAGASGIVSTNFQQSTIGDALRELLTRRLSEHLARSQRVPAKHHIQLKVASLEQALVAETLNVGIGGLFVRVVPDGVKIGDAVDFEFELTPIVSDQRSSESQSDPNREKMEAVPSDATRPQRVERIRGSGIVVWVRPLPDKGTPEGIGLQFNHIDEATLTLIQNFIKGHRVSAFIPKS